MKLISSQKKKIVVLLILAIFLITISTSFAATIPDYQSKSIQEDNIKTSQGLIYDGLEIGYMFTFEGQSNNSEVTYTHKSGGWFNVSWWIQDSGISSWLENKNTRLIENDTGDFSFKSAEHTPLWIFDNVSISDVVLICIDYAGDFPYMVVKEFTYNLPGFGSIEVWELENLISPGWFAWYEKSTGFLIKGNFPFMTDNYTLEITHTNANFNYVTPITAIFDGLYMHYEATWNGGPLVPTNFTYHEYLLDVYNVTWVSFLGGIGTWNVEVSTRTMTNPQGEHFLPGIYEPGWIHTDASLNDIVLIAVDGDGDYIFNITGETVYNLAGYGKIGIWILEDVFNPNCTAWFEKSTGILIKGTFIYPMGNYTLNLLRTNALFNYITTPGGIPGFYLFFAVSLFGILSLVILTQRRIEKSK